MSKLKNKTTARFESCCCTVCCELLTTYSL